MTPAETPFAFAPYPALTTLAAVVLTISILLPLMVWLRRMEGAHRIDTPRVVLSLVVALTFVAVTVYASLRSLPENEPAGQLLGALISAFTIVITYWFTRVVDGNGGDEGGQNGPSP